MIRSVLAGYLHHGRRLRYLICLEYCGAITQQIHRHTSTRSKRLPMDEDSYDVFLGRQTFIYIPAVRKDLEVRPTVQAIITTCTRMKDGECRSRQIWVICHSSFRRAACQLPCPNHLNVLHVTFWLDALPAGTFLHFPVVPVIRQVLPHRSTVVAKQNSN